MPTETQTPRIESGKVRLIDANALILKLRNEINESDESPYYDGKTFLQAGIYESIATIENEPTIS